MVVTQVTLHPKLVYGSAVVVTHFGLLCIVANSHAHVRAAAIAPYVVWELKPVRGGGEVVMKKEGRKGGRRECDRRGVV